jgi:hypothetical protein
MSGSVKNTADTPQSSTVTETTDISVGAFPDAAATTFPLTLSSSQVYSQAGGQTDPFGPFSPSDSNGATYTLPADLAGFTGLGTFSIAGSTLTGETIAGGGGNVIGTLTTTAGVNVTLTYNFTANAPEPGSLLLAGLGVIGLIWTVGRRRKA